ncbi:hypothetical protein RB653_004966 [Dictyostelium firmibasis]|uniref:Uncharacterized protein n=1 Tax=Dictyostelium firmibasis TaxID=79012 RepID=A0AAN7U6S1_9MYCE
MKLILILVLILSVVTSSFSMDVEKNEASQIELQSSRDYGYFALGFAEGINISLTGNLRVCVANISLGLCGFSLSFSLIDSGLKHDSSGDAKSGIRDFGNHLIHLVHYYQKCGVRKFISEISAISKEVTNETGILKVTRNTTIEISHNKHDLTSDFKSAISDCGRGDYTGCGVASGRIVGILMRQ